jgi:hypothetical protein
MSIYKEYATNKPSIRRFSPCLEVMHKASLAALYCLLVTQSFILCLMNVTGPHEMEQPRPNWLASNQLERKVRTIQISEQETEGTDLNPVLPFTILVIPYKQESADFVGDARVTSESGLHRTGLHGAL